MSNALAKSAVAVPFQQRELLRSHEVRAMLAMKPSKFSQAIAAGDLPDFLDIQGVRLWRKRELIDWVNEDCPPVKAHGWKWRPSVKAKLSTVHAQLARDICEMKAEWDRLDEMLKTGDRIIALRGSP